MTHPEKVKELIEIAKEEVVSRSDIREIAKEKKYEKDIEEVGEAKSFVPGTNVKYART